MHQLVERASTEKRRGNTQMTIQLLDLNEVHSALGTEEKTSEQVENSLTSLKNRCKGAESHWGVSLHLYLLTGQEIL